MSFIVESNQERTFKNVPVGSHLGRCYRIIDLGSQKSEYMGEVKVQRKSCWVGNCLEKMTTVNH